MRRTVVSSAFVLVLLALLAGAGGALAAQAQRASVPSGQRLLMARATDWSHPSHIWSVAADGSGLRRLTPSRSNDYAPAWSPDHTSIAYIHDGRGPATLWRMDADGSHRRRIRYSGPSLASAASALAWSPDGRSIAGGCRMSKNLLRVAVTVLDLSAGRSRRLVTYPYYTKVTSLDWSSDSSRLLVCGMSADPGSVDVLDVAGGDIWSMGVSAYSAAWSPDGAHFVVAAFMDDATGLWPPDEYQVELRDEYGDYVSTLYGTENWSGACAYAPDGASCAYAGGDNQHGRLYVQPADGSQPPTAILTWGKGIVGGVAWK
jgi:WD40 repeat protein